MDATFHDNGVDWPVIVTGVLHAGRVQIRFCSECPSVVVPLSMLDLNDGDRAVLVAVIPAGLSAVQYRVLDGLAEAGVRGLLDSEYPPLSRTVVTPARRALRQRGWVSPSDTSVAEDGRMSRWRLTSQGVVEHRAARRLVRPIGSGELAAARSG